MKVIYVAQENSDQTEGKGRMVDIAHFEKREDALVAAKGRGVMGIGDGEVREIRVYNSISDWEEGIQQDLRASGLSKLSPEEARALGLTKF